MESIAQKKGVGAMLVIVIAGLMVTSLNQSIINVALPQIMKGFDITAATAQWLSTGYMLVSGILVPISAFLVQRFSYKQLFITSMLFFMVGSMICAISGSFTLLLAGRIFQAVGGGIILPLGMNIFMYSFPPEKRGSAMGLVGLAIILAPAIGPTISGYVIQSYDWNVMFYAMAIAAICVIVAAIFVFKFQNERVKAKFDSIGAILSTIGFGSLLYGVSEAGIFGWGDPKVIGFLVVAVVVLIMFVVYLLKKKNPLLELKVFKDFNFSYTIIVNIILTVALNGGVLLLPIYMQQVRGFTPLSSGLLLLPGALIMGIMGIFTGRLFDKFGIKPLAIMGIAIMTGVTLMLSTLTLETPYWEIILLYSFRSFGMAFVLMPITSAGLMTVKQELIPHATALQNTLKQIAGAVGTAILVVIMTNKSKDYISSAADITVDIKLLAAVHGINSAFLVASIIGGAAFILSLFFKSKRRISYVED